MLSKKNVINSMLVTVILLAKEKIIMLATEFFLSKKNVFSSMLANIVGLCFAIQLKSIDI